MLPSDMFSYVKKKVLNGPEPSRPRPRPRPSKPTRTSALSSAAVRQRYGMSEASYEAHRAASADRRKSVYGDAATLLKLRDTISTGVRTAQDTVSKLSVPGDSEAEPPKPGSLGGRRGSAVNLSRLGSAGTLTSSTSNTSSSATNWKAKEPEKAEVTAAVAATADQHQQQQQPELVSKDQEAAFTKMKQLYAKPTPEENARCKVCFKKFHSEEFFRLCTICDRKVCEDCSASYANKEPEGSWKCSICNRRLTNAVEDGNRPKMYLKAAGMAVVAQNRFRSTGKAGAKRQDSFHAEGKRNDPTSGGLAVPEQQARRHSTGNVAATASTINIAALQPNLENLTKKSPLGGGQHAPKGVGSGIKKVVAAAASAAASNGTTNKTRPTSTTTAASEAPKEPTPSSAPAADNGGRDRENNMDNVRKTATSSQGSHKGLSQLQQQQKMTAVNHDGGGQQQPAPSATMLSSGQSHAEERRASFESAKPDDSLLAPALSSRVQRKSAADLRFDANSNQQKQQEQQRLYQAHYQQQLSGEGIQIVVDHFDQEGQSKLRKQQQQQGEPPQQPPGSRRGSSSACTTRQITLYNLEGNNGDYGFGLRVVGQMDADTTVGRVLWINPGGPAHVGGIKVGDKILEWDGLPLSTVPIDDIPEFVENCGSSAVTALVQSKNIEECNNGNDSQGRRRLPTLPPSRSSPRSSFSAASTSHQPQQPRGDCGWIQLGLCFENANLIVTLWAAEGLHMIESMDSMALPKPYAIVRLCMFGCNRSFSTDVESATQTPVWATKHVFTDIEHEEVLNTKLDVTVWNFSHNVKHECIGRTILDPSNMALDGGMHWWPLTPPENDQTTTYEEPPHEQPPKQPQTPQRSSQQQRDPMTSGSSSQSHFLDTALPPSDRYKMRRKSDCGFGAGGLGGQMSIAQQLQLRQQQQQQQHHFDPDQQGHPQRPRRNRSLDRSNVELDQLQLQLSMHRNAGLGGSHYGLQRPQGRPHAGSTTHLNLQLGPLQFPPHPHFGGEFAHCGELKLGFFLSDDYLEIEIVSARDLPNADTGRPDTYVTTQLIEGDRRFLTRRTGIVRQLTNPLYRQTVKYLTSDVSRRGLVASIWARPPPEIKYEPTMMIEGEECLGMATIDIDKLAMKQLLVGWYKLFPCPR